MGKYIQTAQFARMCSVSKQTLIYYDRIGLFHPHHCDARGYRFYDITQHEAFMDISLLAELDTPLEEIKSYQKRKSPEAFLKLMEDKRMILDEKIRRYQDMARIMDRRTAQVRKAQTVSDSEISVKELAEERLLLSAPLRNQSDEEFVRIISESEQQQNKAGIISYGYGALVDMKRFLASGEYWVSRLTFHSEFPVPEEIIKPAGLYVCGFHRGSFSTITRAYERLNVFIRNEGMRVAGDAYEDVLLDSFTQSREEEFLIGIAIAVEEGLP